MSLAPRTRLGPYEIVEPAGAGGMGEVYRARDTRLGRDVALKVLPPALLSDPAWGQRLEREARAISALSHPHICPLYDIGHDQGLQYLVMEFLEGETLAQRLARGPLPLAQAIRHGGEIAGALHAAHRKGFVHRDLKPGNVMLTRAGAKLLDFGLAKAMPPLSGLGGAALTASAPLTAEGSLVGTIHYMAPEQLEGKDADARSDIFALGAVLFEMVTGRRAFDGASTASVIAAILERQPPSIATLQPLSPPALDSLVRGCLAKDPEERWQTAHDVKLQLASIAVPESAETPPVTSAARWRAALPWGIASLAAIAAIGLALAGSGRGASAPPRARPEVLRASLLPPAGHSFTPNDFAISPDGRRVIFVATGADGVATLWVRSIDASQPTEVSGSEGASGPFWSPDGRMAGFFARGRLWKVQPGQTGPELVCPTSTLAGGGAWSAGNVILFSNAVIGPLMKVPANGGTPEPVTSVPDEARGEAHRFPHFLPDGERFLYVASWTNERRGGVYLGRTDGRAATLVSSEIRGRVHLAGDHLIFLRAGTLYAQPFDVAAGTLTGIPQPVVRDELVEDWRFGAVPLSVSETGIMLFQSRLSYNSQLVWYDRAGKELGPVGPPGYGSPALSPDGRRVAVTFDSVGSGQPRVWVYDLERQVPAPLTSEGSDTAVSWSGDGRWLAYSSQRERTGIFRRSPDGSGREEVLVESPWNLIVNGYSANARRLLFMDFRSGLPELRAHDLDTRQSEIIEPGAEGAYSPDGQWISYIAYPSGGLTIRSARGGARIALAASGGSQLRWRGDSQEIFYVAPDKKLMAVPLAVRNGQLEPGPAAALFQTRIVQPRLVLFQYDVTADGQRFLINSLPREDAAAPLTMLINWQQQIGK